MDEEVPMDERTNMERDLMRMYAQVLEAFVHIHETIQHDGRLCPLVRADVIAFLTHRLGADITKVTEYLEVYDQAHEEREKGS